MEIPHDIIDTARLNIKISHEHISEHIGWWELTLIVLVNNPVIGKTMCGYEN